MNYGKCFDRMIKDVIMRLMDNVPRNDYYATLEVDSEWATGSVSEIFGVFTHPNLRFAILNGWVLNDTHPYGLSIKVVLAEDVRKIVQGVGTEYRTGECFIPWRYVRYIAYLEEQKSPTQEITLKTRNYGF